MVMAMVLLGACVQEEPLAEEEFNVAFAQGSSETISPEDMPSPVKNIPLNRLITDSKINPNLLVEPSPCGPTPFDAVISASIDSNIDALGASWFFDYVDFNFFYTITDPRPQYFGANGQYTNLVRKIERNLVNFWDMPGEITVRGQHNATLDNEEILIEILTFWYGFPEADAALFADFFVNFVNVESTFLVETPLISFDGFAIALGGLLGQGDLIVIGDGIVELLSETGVEDKVVWNGIMAHEWAHHIQFNNFGDWYPGGAADNEPEATRTTELEADFFTGYYLTHKRGGTYNWKRVEDFLALFFNIGDCGFTSSGHHGTPIQRMEAAHQGYLLARAAKANGKILSEQEVHDVFLSKLDDIIDSGFSGAE